MSYLKKKVRYYIDVQKKRNFPNIDKTEFPQKSFTRNITLKLSDGKD